ncbi:unnamed protein product [Rhodiola kirilowii]
MSEKLLRVHQIWLASPNTPPSVSCFFRQAISTCEYFRLNVFFSFYMSAEF